jgi:hypothetical protein
MDLGVDPSVDAARMSACATSRPSLLISYSLGMMERSLRPAGDGLGELR